jgi:hypothetical protein
MPAGPCLRNGRIPRQLEIIRTGVAGPTPMILLTPRMAVHFALQSTHSEVGQRTDALEITRGQSQAAFAASSICDRIAFA